MNDDQLRPIAAGAASKFGRRQRFWLLVIWLGVVLALSLVWPLAQLSTRLRL